MSRTSAESSALSDSLAPVHPLGNTAGMSEQGDYEDCPGKKRRPPSLRLLALIIIAGMYVLAVVGFGLLLLSFMVNFPAQD